MVALCSLHNRLVSFQAKTSAERDLQPLAASFGITRLFPEPVMYRNSVHCFSAIYLDQQHLPLDEVGDYPTGTSPCLSEAPSLLYIAILLQEHLSTTAAKPHYDTCLLVSTSMSPIGVRLCGSAVGNARKTSVWHGAPCLLRAKDVCQTNRTTRTDAQFW